MSAYNTYVLDERGPIIQVPFQFLIENGITINEYLIISLINDTDLLKLYSQKIENLDSSLKKCYENNFIKLLDKKEELSYDNIEVSAYYKGILQSNDPANWIDEWYNLWPNGVKSSGYYVKTDKYSCIKKLQKFRRKYPMYSKSIILEATSNYINRMGLVNYAFMRLAPYFIEKDGISTLAGECEQIISATSTNTSDNTFKFGENVY